MKHSICNPNCLVLVIFVGLFSSIASAALGGNAQSIEADSAKLHAKAALAQSSYFAVHEMTTPTGVVVREYLSPQGQVFGVSWNGPFIPDMKQLLGDYFSHFSDLARTQRESHVGRRPINIQESRLVVQTSGHMRSFHGRAFDPELVPAGVSVSDIR